MSVIKYFAKGDMCEVEFHLPQQAAKGATEVQVVGEFSDWSWEKVIPMSLENGMYIGTTILPIDSTFQYRYLMDNQRWENDWYADDYVPSDCGAENSVVDTSIEIVFSGTMHFKKCPKLVA